MYTAIRGVDNIYQNIDMGVKRIRGVNWHRLLVVALCLQEGKAAYGVLVMAMYWMTEAIPLPATALLPMILFPMLGLRDAKDVAINYLKVGVTQAQGSQEIISIICYIHILHN